MTAALSNSIQEVENLETYSLIWLDTSVNISKENSEIQQQLRTIINYFVIFEDEQQCLVYIHSQSKDSRIVLIINEKFIQQIVPKIIYLQQVNSIYIYCNEKKTNEPIPQHFKKIKGSINHLDELIQQIQKTDESLSFSIFDPKRMGEKLSTTSWNGQFMYSQLLINSLIRIEPSSNDKNELIALCKQQYKNNQNELNMIKEFEKDYSSERSLWWYTRHSFLYRLLNKAFRVRNIDLLMLLRFFIRDMARELKKNKCSSSVRAYRAQPMSKEDLETLLKSAGNFVSVNSFLSTSPNREQTRSFLFSSASSDDVEKVFFEIDVKSRLGNIKAFSNITSHSYSPNRDEVLFTIGSIFRLVHIDRDNDGVWNIQLSLSSYKDHQLQSLFQYMKKELGNEEKDILSFGFVLEDRGELNDAEKYFHRVLTQLPNDHKDISRCYHALGEITQKKGDYDLSLNWYNKSLEIDMRTLKVDDPNIGTTYNSIAVVHSKKGDYTRALEAYQKTFDIWKKAFGEDHPDVAMCYNNMGVVYQEEKKYSEALEFYHKAWNIRQKSLSAEHPCLGPTHACIGNVHYHLGRYDLALEHYNLSLEIFKKSLLPHHRNILLILRNIGLVYQSKGEFQQALSYLEKVAAIYRHSLPSTHPDVIHIEQIIHRISSKL